MKYCDLPKPEYIAYALGRFGLWDYLRICFQRPQLVLFTLIAMCIPFFLAYVHALLYSRGQTFGYLVTGLTCVDKTGTPFGFWRMLLRSLGLDFNVPVGALCFWFQAPWLYSAFELIDHVVLFTKGRYLHDYVTGAYVISNNAEPMKETHDKNGKGAGPFFPSPDSSGKLDMGKVKAFENKLRRQKMKRSPWLAFFVLFTSMMLLVWGLPFYAGHQAAGTHNTTGHSKQTHPSVPSSDEILGISGNCKKVLCMLGIENQKDWRGWAQVNHPDKDSSSDEDIFKVAAACVDDFRRENRRWSVHGRCHQELQFQFDSLHAMFDLLSDLYNDNSDQKVYQDFNSLLIWLGEKLMEQGSG